MIGNSSFSSLPARLPAGLHVQEGDTLESLLAKALHLQAGGSGVTGCADTLAKPVRVSGFLVLVDSVFDILVADTGYAISGITGMTLTPGWYPFRAAAGWKLTSGRVIGINA